MMQNQAVFFKAESSILVLRLVLSKLKGPNGDDAVAHVLLPRRI